MGDRLAGRIAIVTGAARGLGRAFCLAFACEGADVVAVDLADASATTEAVAALGRRALALRLDVSVEEDVARLAHETLEAFDRIDVLVNNAALSPQQPFDEITFADWRRILSVNVDGVFLCTKAVVPAMRQQGRGRIINIASDTVFTNIPELVHYVTAKAGVIGMTRALATELGVHGITVNSISPGLTETERTALVDEQYWLMQVQAQAIKRRGVPPDIAGLAVFLASDDAAFITGQNVCVNGGAVKH